MSMSAFKEGNRVRCTLGESVMVGLVSGSNDIHVYVIPDGSNTGYALTLNAWAVTVIRPPVPNYEGVVVLDRHGEAWQQAGGWFRAGWNEGLTLHELEHGYGPVTVIHVPEDSA